MKLLYAPTSPYARKARMVVIEKGLQDRVEMIAAIPYENPPELVSANPLGKVPALITDDGRTLFDSPVICHFLDSLAPEPQLASEGADRWEMLTREALCDGILDAALGIVMEGRRPAEQRSPDWLERWDTAIKRALKVVEADIAGYQGRVTMAQVALGAVLGYLDLRLRADLPWRDGHPRLAAWHEAFSERPSMKATVPEG